MDKKVMKIVIILIVLSNLVIRCEVQNEEREINEFQYAGEEHGE